MFIYFHTSKVDRGRMFYFCIMHFSFKINVLDHFDPSKVYQKLKNNTCIKIHLHQHLTLSQAKPCQMYSKSLAIGVPLRFIIKIKIRNAI